jgi:hypothetical protein
MCGATSDVRFGPKRTNRDSLDQLVARALICINAVPRKRVML